VNNAAGELYRFQENRRGNHGGECLKMYDKPQTQRMDEVSTWKTRGKQCYMYYNVINEAWARKGCIRMSAKGWLKKKGQSGLDLEGKINER